MGEKRWEHFPHEADIGVRGIGASPAEWCIRGSSPRIWTVYGSWSLVVRGRRGHTYGSSTTVTLRWISARG
jgi:hypothetical protein